MSAEPFSSPPERPAAPARDPGTKAFSTTDLAVFLGLPLLFTISWLVPERLWPRLCRRIGPLAVPMLAGDAPARVRLIRRTLGATRLKAAPKEILSELAGEQILSILQLLKGYRPGGWKPAIALSGKAHIEAALARGRGAILWVSYSVYGDLISKMAFHRAGLAVSHLSRASHGFSDTRFGARFLNRLQTAIEDRFIGERVSLTAKGATGALDHLRARLGDNRAVTFTVHRNAKRPATVPFMDGQLHLAPGAAVLARKTGAPLLPVFAFRDETGGLTVTVGAPLEMAEELPTEAVVEQAARQYAAALDPYVRRYPGQWRGWLHL